MAEAENATVAQRSDSCNNSDEDYQDPEWAGFTLQENATKSTATQGSDSRETSDEDYQDPEWAGYTAQDTEFLKKVAEMEESIPPIIDDSTEDTSNQLPYNSSSTSRKEERGYITSFLTSVKKKFTSKSNAEELLVIKNGTHSHVSADIPLLKQIFHRLNAEDKPALILKNLLNCVQKMISKDFPFYLILSQWLNRHGVHDQDLTAFRMKCIGQMKLLKPECIVETLLSFFERKDFMVELRDRKEKAFILLRDASMQMSAVQLEASGDKCQSLYTKLIWISIILRCKKEYKQETTRQIEEIWNNHLLKDKDKILFDPTTMRELCDGLGLMEVLDISKLSTKQIVSLAIKRPMRNFSEMRNYTKEVVVFTDEPEEFVQQLFYDYIKQLPQTMEGLQLKGGIAFIEEGITFVMEINSSLLSKKSSKEYQSYEQKLLLWLLRLSLSDLKHPDAPKCLELFFGDEKFIHVLDAYKVELKNLVIEKTTAKLRDLTPEQMLSLYSTADIWPKKLLAQYFSQCTLSSTFAITKAPWSEFISLISKRSPDAHEHDYLLAFLKRCKHIYDMDGRYMPLLIDLMQLRIPNLLVGGRSEEDLCVRSEFIEFINQHINFSPTKDLLKKKIKEIIAMIQPDSAFHQLIQAEIQKAVAPLQYELKWGLPEMLKLSVNTLRSQPPIDFRSSMAKFCWNIVTSCCSAISIQRDTLSWIEEYNISIRELCSLHRTLQHPDVYHQWLCNLKEVLLTLNNRIMCGDCNYDQLLQYESYQDKLPSYLLTNEENCTQRIAKQARRFEDLFLQMNLTLILSLQGYELFITLHNLLHKYQIDVPAEITQHLILPQASVDKSGLRNANELQAIVVSSTKHKVCIHVKQTTMLHMLDTLVNDHLVNFMQPLKDYISILTFFHFYHSRIFNEYINMQLRILLEPSQKKRPENFILGIDDGNDDESTPKVLTTHILAEATGQAVKQLVNLIEGKSTYSEVVAFGQINIEQLDIDAEFGVFSTFSKLKLVPIQSECGLDGLKHLLKLFQLPDHIDCIYNVCEQFNLEGCLNDPTVSLLCEKATYLKSKQSKGEISLSQAIELLKSLNDSLCYSSPDDEKCIELFKLIINCIPFRNFILEMKFDREDGQVIFQQQYQLVTAQLQHEEYNENVLNHLFAAMKLMAPFLDTNQNLKSLMTRVTKLDWSEGLDTLTTVSENITTIQLWFSRVEGDTLQNLSSELQFITSSGVYEYCFQQQKNVTMEIVCDRSKRLSQEQINDFIRRLGFMDVNGENMQRFRELNEMAEMLLSLLYQLVKSGHSIYLQGCIQIKCNSKFLKEKLDEMKEALLKWKHKLESLQNKNKWLLFFSTAKLLSIHKSIESAQRLSTDECMLHEIGILFNNDKVGIAEMNSKVKAAIEETKDAFRSSETIMDAVSSYLAVLLKDHTLPVRIKNPLMERPLDDFNVLLHSCSDRNIVPTILNIFDGVPHPFQIFRCHSLTTEEELSLFLQQAGKHTCQHLILEINRLPFQVQEFLMLYFEKKRKAGSQDLVKREPTNVELLETAQSNLRELPWIFKQNHKDCKLKKSSEFENSLLPSVHLVYGSAGGGKTYFIKDKLAASSASVVIAINEAYTTLAAIKKLRCLPYKPDCAIHINFLIPPHGNADITEYNDLFDIIRWFLFDLLILGYIEDRTSGLSFRLPGGLKWTFYIEVPCGSLDQDSNDALQLFCNEIPLFNVLGSPHLVPDEIPFSVTMDVQLVCKYLKAYQDQRIDALIEEDDSEMDIIKFSTDPDLPNEECNSLLEKYAPRHQRKIHLELFIMYMKNRCKFLDALPGFNYNTGGGEAYENEAGVLVATDTRYLGSTIIGRMLGEVKEFCNSSRLEHWNSISHNQLIYDFKDGGGTLGFITSKPEEIDDDDRAKLKSIGVKIPSKSDMNSRKILDSYLSRALNIPLQNDCLTAIDDSKYVLTLDYAIKMLSIHERCRCGLPVIIQGETGVGKTALIKMLSRLWNHSFHFEWKTERSRLCEFLTVQSKDFSSQQDIYLKCVQAIHENKAVEYADLLVICQNSVSTKPGPQNPGYNLALKKYLISKKNVFIFSMLQSKDATGLDMLFNELDSANEPQKIAVLLQVLCSARLRTTFFKILVHAALTPQELEIKLQTICNEARLLKALNENSISPTPNVIPEGSTCKMMPSVTLFLDEINTASCLGLLKELIIDRTINGEPVPDNLFIVAACNPYRGSSLASHGDGDWIRGSYYVRPLPPSLQLIMWDYGSLSSEQEQQYIDAKMKMLDCSVRDTQIVNLATLIVMSQNLMRQYAYEQLNSKCSGNEALIRSYSCVSQRDIERVLKLYQWLIKSFSDTKRKVDPNPHRYAMMVALGLVYYMRLNKEFRKAYSACLNEKGRKGEVKFLDAFQKEITFYTEHIDLPHGIAKTQALMENIFATIVCTVTRIPLVIVGAPGSSKTLSFNIVVSNLKGQESKKELFRKSSVFPSLDPHYYQCSKRTTSTEVETVFLKAKNRQLAHNKLSIPSCCVVFMDEAGLPEESHESLKVLHYYLDKSEVSFVGITNHVLDAAKMNRAISLFRPESVEDDLIILAKGCLSSKKDADNEIVTQFCSAYLSVARECNFRCFGLRDFIHFINYLRRFLNPHEEMSETVMKSLERNFNGFENFGKICDAFLAKLNTSYEAANKRHILDILRDSLCDKATSEQSNEISPNVNKSTENEVRYKLIIDPSEDDSLVRLLFTSKCLERKSTHIFVSSDLPGDSDLQKVNTIAAIIHSVREGHTVVMAQTDDIHESFYDLFNQHFRKIIDPTHGTRYYTNIAIGAHSKPCRVHPNFQCIVVVKQSEVLHMPPPFLNRFEKFCLTHNSILDAALQEMPVCMCIMMRTVKEKVEEFVDMLKRNESFYGLQDDTINSLLLSVLPISNYTFNKDISMPSFTSSSSVLTRIIQAVQFMLQHSIGFQIMSSSLEELELDCRHIHPLLSADSEFEYLLHTEVNVTSAVREAFIILHEAPAPDTERCNRKLGLSPEACMVVATLIQWLIRYFCKKLMQLMTPEALTIHRMKIASTYIDNYLQYQGHFSLKKLISTSHNSARNNQHGVNNQMYTCQCRPTKLLCYTRSAPLLHKIPASYPLQDKDSHEHDTVEILNIKELIFDAAEHVMISKITKTSSQATLTELLRIFGQNDAAEILLLVVNMQDTSKKAINHIRIMIEEAENQIESQKLYVLLLHFSPSNQQYPALFLRGWDHHYLDTISHNCETGVLDVENWFKVCCISEVKSKDDQNDSLISTLHNLLHECVPVISSQVTFGNTECSTSVFNTKMSLSQRNDLLRQLLFTKKVGYALCKRFRSYWTSGIMALYVEQAAMFSQGQQSLHISDPIQARFKALFFDFMVYMIAQVNHHYNLDILFERDCPQSVEQLFLSLLSMYPIPLFESLKTLSCSLAIIQKPTRRPPTFPFFHMVMQKMEQFIDDGRKEINMKLNVLNEKASQGKAKLLETLQEMAKEHEESDSNDPLGITWKAMKENEDLWLRYFNDFCCFKMHLDHTAEISLQQDFINSLIHCNDSNYIKNMIQLHTSAVFATISTILRPLGILYQTFSNSSISLQLLSQNEPYNNFAFAVTSFVVNVLFEDLKICSQIDITSNDAFIKLKTWQKVYKDTMALPSLSAHMYTSLAYCKDEIRCADVKLKFDIVQTMFAVLQSNTQNSDGCYTMAFKILTDCINMYSSNHMAAVEDVSAPEQYSMLATMVTIVLKNSTQGSTNCHIQLVMGGLFSHFFNHAYSYHQGDCEFFFKMANQQYHWFFGTTLSAATSEIQNEMPKISIGMFKHYLLRILMVQQTKHDAHSSTVEEDPTTCIPRDKVENVTWNESHFLFNVKLRSLVAKALLSVPDLGTLSHYIPLCYQQCPHLVIEKTMLSKRMNQPLAHLYFLAALEALHNCKYDVAQLLTYVEEMKQGLSPSNDESILTFIDLQAVVQILIQQLALIIDPDDHSLMSPINTINSGINFVLDEDATGGGSCKGHYYVLLLHLYRKLKHDKFISLLTADKHQQVRMSFKCLSSAENALKNNSTAEPREYLSFILDQKELELYRHVRHMMKHLCVDELLKTAADCATSGKEGLFRMVLWLVAFYEYYDKNKKNVPLCAAIGTKEFSHYFADGETRLIQCFINPDMMVNNPVEGTETAEYDPNQHEEKTELQKKRDPLYEWFLINREDVELSYCLANLTAVIMACPRQNNHLWYHLYALHKLHGSYIPSFMIECAVDADPYHYDCGIILDDNGDLIDDEVYRTSPFTPKSYCILLLLNFGAICMGLISQSEVDKNISGPIFSEWHKIRYYCIIQTRRLWLFLKSKLNKSSTEITFLVSKCLRRFYEMNSGPNASKHIKGVYKEFDELRGFEQLWQKEVYEVSMNAKLEQHSENSIFETIRKLDDLDEQYPTVQFLDDVKRALNDSTVFKEECFLLKQFLLQYERLQAGGCLLPYLVQFYQWLHVHLAHIVTQEQASVLKIKKVVDLAAARASEKESKNLLDLFTKLKTSYNAYVHIIDGMIGAGACGQAHRENQIAPIDDETALLHFLSDTVEAEEGNDWLYNVMVDIVAAHNAFIDMLYHKAHTDNITEILCLLPSKPSKISIIEFTETHSIAKADNNSTESFLQLARSHYCYYPANIDTITNLKHEFDLLLLQEDVIKMYCIGKPMIEEPVSIRSPFKFHSGMGNVLSPTQELTGLVSPNVDVIEALQKLSESSQMKDVERLLHQLEFEFHSADYSAMLEALQVFKNVFGHLAKENIQQEDVRSLTTIHGFMEYLGDPLIATVTKLSESQQKFIYNLQICSIMPCYKQFVAWHEDEMFNFHYLKLAFKSHLMPKDKQSIEEIPSKWKGDMNTLCKELNSLSTNLTNSETTLTGTDDLQIPIVKFLTDLMLFEDEDLLPTLIPPTVCLKHYVHFRIALKRLTTSVQLSISTLEVDLAKRKWREDVSELWERQLPHFRDSKYSTCQKTIAYGFGNEEHIVSGLKEDLEFADLTNEDPLITEQPIMLDTGAPAELNFGSNDGNAPIAPTFQHASLDGKDVASQGTGQMLTEEEATRAKTIDMIDIMNDLGMELTDDITHLYGDEFLSKPEEDIKETLNIKPSDYFKLYATLRRRIRGVEAKFDLSTVQTFLETIKLHAYTKAFKTKGIDGDMLLEADSSMLQEKLAVKDPIHRLKIKVLFPKFVNKLPPRESCSVVIEWLQCNGMQQYAEKFQTEGIDGDLIRSIDEDSLKTLGVVDAAHCAKILQLRDHEVLLQNKTPGIMETAV